MNTVDWKKINFIENTAYIPTTATKIFCFVLGLFCKLFQLSKGFSDYVILETKIFYLGLHQAPIQ